MAIIRRSTTRITAMVLDTARGFTSEASLAVWDGAAGDGGRTGSTARSLRTITSSTTMASMAFMATGGWAAAGSGRTIRRIGWGWHIPIEVWPPVSAPRVDGWPPRVRASRTAEAWAPMRCSAAPRPAR